VKPKRALAAAAAAAAALLPASAGAATTQGKPRLIRLSDERTETVYAYVRRPVWVRRRPSYRSRQLSRLTRHTFYGSAESVVVVWRTEDARGRTWYRVRYPGLGRRVGWVPGRALADFEETDTLLVINRRRLRLRLYRRGRTVLRAAVGVGARRSPTPKGRYYIRERLVPRNRRGIYGILAFGTSAFSRYRTDWPGGGQVGVHGTNQPDLIPGRISNGCVRLRNRDVRRLDRSISIGTPVVIK